MQLRIRRLALLILPLLAAACAPALTSNSAQAPEVTARRAGYFALDVNASQPAYAYVLEMRPDGEEVLQLLNGGEPTALAPGRQRIGLDAAAGEPSSRTADVRQSGYDRRYCSQGERLVYVASPAGALSNARPVNVRGRRWYCVREFVRSSAPRTSTRQTLLVITSARPVSPEALYEAVASVNARFASARRSSDAIFAVTQDALRERGIQSYAVRVR